MGQKNFSFAQGLGQLEIGSQKECESLGGTWNDCPPNDCQKSDGYKKGEVTCPAVCGQSYCEGIVPEEKGDLSEIQNPTLYKKSESLNEDSITPSNAVVLTAPPLNQNSKQLLDYRKIARLSAVIVGLLILYAYYLLKHKKRKHR